MAKIRRSKRHSFHHRPRAGNRDAARLTGLVPALRMKGGVALDPTAGGWVAIVHTWDNADCVGEPTEWRSPDVFPSEEKAMTYYKKSIRPSLTAMMKEMQTREAGTVVDHRELE